MAPVRSMKCIRRPPSRLPRMLVSLGRMISVISDWVLATVRAIGLAGLKFWVALMVRLLHSPFKRLAAASGRVKPAGQGWLPTTMELATAGGAWLLFQFRQSRPNTQIPRGGIGTRESAGEGQDGQDRGAKRDSCAGPQEQFCPLWLGNGVGQGRRDGGGAGGVRHAAHERSRIHGGLLHGRADPGVGGTDGGGDRSAQGRERPAGA